MRSREVRGTYGSRYTPCTVLVASDRGGSWYAVEGSQNVNHTTDDIEDGVDVETLADDDTITWPDGVHDLDDLDRAIEA